ncbi:hypothetical protein PsAD2_00300 [Pseudovibrio axinellae]|uniref:Uncharacterized protein n=1 Tax=Pseudovibrio axinellae TaxID=989403 RepID=A0A166B3Y7_9HYPH|nr:hypothetical protein PsAD2_00300 [Pseudovibrio axinellae]SEQ81696.1 hypothetical protein SAMN05421798_104298 [Pseudovibrio axinellae]
MFQVPAMSSLAFLYFDNVLPYFSSPLTNVKRIRYGLPRVIPQKY